jgi:tetratricopeptide (TPR) repeat protein
MSTAVMTHRLELNSAADSALKAAARFWFVVVLIGQFVFAFSIASFYSLTAFRGGLQSWNTRLPNGYVAGDTLGNSALIGHILFAAVISFAGALQLIPRLRNSFPAFHRWNGLLYLLAAFTQGISGLYLVSSGRKVVGDLSQHVGLWISAALMILCAAMALRYALLRDFKTHRKWAFRLFLVASGSWFFRVGLFLSFLIFNGPFGFDPNTFTGPFLTSLTFAEFLLPLAVLEIYFQAQERPGVLRRAATAFILVVLALGIGAGSFAFTMAMSLPAMKAAFDPRKSIFSTLSATIASDGVDAAITQYRNLKSASPASYNFDEGELNTLGYQLLRAKKFNDAIRIFQLNVEAYPQSSNVYDSLGEAYTDDGVKPLAIANYEKSLQLNPKNHNAELMLHKLNAP